MPPFGRSNTLRGTAPGLAAVIEVPVSTGEFSIRISPAECFPFRLEAVTHDN